MRVEVRVSLAPGKVECRRIGKISSVFPQIGPARLKEQEEWLRANPMKGDPFEGLLFDDD